MAEKIKMVKYTTKDKIYKFPLDVLETIKKNAKVEKIPMAKAVERWLNEHEGLGTIEDIKAEANAPKTAAPKKRKESKPRTVTYTDEELKIVSIIAEALKNAEVGEVTQPKAKTINVMWNGVEYSINVVKHRPPKA